MQITKNTVVSFHYTLNDADGKLLDTSAGREAFAYIQGQSMIVPGLERQLEGKKAGDAVKAVVPARELCERLAREYREARARVCGG